MLLSLLVLIQGGPIGAGGIAVGAQRQTEVAPPRVEAEIVVDGRLDEAVWSQATTLTGFTQFAPSDGVAAADSTRVLVWYSPTAIHFGIRAFARLSTC